MKTIVEQLKPRVNPHPPRDVGAGVMTEIRNRKKITIMRNIAASIALVAVVGTTALLSFRPQNVYASDVAAIIDRSLARANEVTTMVMTLDVRTRPHESFAFTHPALGMERHTLTVSGTRWRLEKDGRTVVFDGTDKWMWVGTTGYKGNSASEFEEWFELLLDPRMVPMREKEALAGGGVKYETKNTDSETVLTAKVDRRGDFSTSDYLRNSSIEESDTKRELTFDRRTGRLKGLKIYARALGVWRPIVEVKDVKYNIVVDEVALAARPDGLEWIDTMVAPVAGRFSGITAAEAARLIGEAINLGDVRSVSEAFANFDASFIERYFAGAKVVEYGEPFRSGTYVGQFVPIRVKFADGKTRKLKLAMRNDNRIDTWQVDGGL